MIAKRTTGGGEVLICKLGKSGEVVLNTPPIQSDYFDLTCADLLQLLVITGHCILLPKHSTALSDTFHGQETGRNRDTDD